MHGPSPSCGLAGRRVVTLGKGVSRVRFLGRFHGRPLAPGTYGITMVARRGRKNTMLGRLAIAVVPANQRVQRSSAKPVFAGCESGSGVGAASSSSGGPFAGLGLVVSTAGLKLVGAPDSPKVTLRPPKLSSVPVPKAPQLPSPSDGGAPWLRLLFYAVVMLAGAGMLLFLLGFTKQRSNP